MSGLIAITESSLTYLRCSWSLSLYICKCLSFLSQSLPWPSSKSHFCCKTPFCQKCSFPLFNCFQLQHFALSTFTSSAFANPLSVLLQQSAFPDLKSAGLWTRSFLGCPYSFNHQLDNSKPHEDAKSISCPQYMYDIIRNNVMSLPFTHNIKCWSY